MRFHPQGMSEAEEDALSLVLVIMAFAKHAIYRARLFIRGVNEKKMHPDFFNGFPHQMVYK